MWVWSYDLPSCDLTKQRHIPDGQTKTCTLMPESLIPHRTKISLMALHTQIAYARSPPRYQPLQEIAKHCRARMTSWSETTVPSFMVQVPLRAAGPTQGHLIHTLTQVILLHDSPCLSTAISNKLTSAQILYHHHHHLLHRRRRRHCHLTNVKNICNLGRCRSVYWLNREIVTRFMRGQRPPLLYSVKLTLGHTQLRIQGIPDAIHPDVKRLVREPDHSKNMSSCN